MSDTKLEFVGLDALRDALRKLPADLSAQAAPVIFGAATDAAAEARANYPENLRSIAERIEVQTIFEYGLGVSALVRQRHRLAWIFEHGTMRRTTARGRNRGVIQPPLHAFLPPMIRHRRRMYAELKEMLIRWGFVVTGNAA